MFPSVVDALISNRQRAYLQQIGLQDPKKVRETRTNAYLRFARSVS